MCFFVEEHLDLETLMTDPAITLCTTKNITITSDLGRALLIVTQVAIAIFKDEVKATEFGKVLADVCYKILMLADKLGQSVRQT